MSCRAAALCPLHVLTFLRVCVSRENLEKLLEDKHFKEEIVHFNISEERGVVDVSHRGRLIPLLMRYCVTAVDKAAAESRIICRLCKETGMCCAFPLSPASLPPSFPLLIFFLRKKILVLSLNH